VKPRLAALAVQSGMVLVKKKPPEPEESTAPNVFHVSTTTSTASPTTTLYQVTRMTRGQRPVF
jgi:hypothetical protein